MSVWAGDGEDIGVEILNEVESNLITTRRLTRVGSSH